MIRIGICDDTCLYRDEAENVCRDICKEWGEEYEITKFEDGKQLLECEKKFDIVILDIEMPEISGIDVKLQLEKENAESFIIFMTHYLQYAVEAFGFNVVGFVNKEKIDKELSIHVKKVIDKIGKNTILEGNVNSRDVCYIKSAGAYCEYHMKDETARLTSKKTLTSFEERLSEVDFVRVHNKYLVNLRWVNSMNDKRVIVNKEELPVAQRRWNKIKKQWAFYDES